MTSLELLLSSPLVNVPFAVAVNGRIFSATESLACDICKSRCKERSCLSSSKEGEDLCDHGVRFFNVNTGSDRILVYGLAPIGDVPRKLRSAFKGRRFPRSVVDNWVKELLALVESIEGFKDSGRQEALDSLHDVAKLASDVASIATTLVGEDLSSVDSTELSLVKSAEMLVKEFERIELLVNPASAAVGRIYTHIYKLCHKYARILDLAYAKPNNKRVRVVGRSFLEIRVYESISVLVFSLIENSIKYSMSEEVVEVEINDGLGSVDLLVTSTGPYIESDEVAEIFDRGFRGKWAQRMGVEGRGLGLYLARLVADAHRTKIYVTSVHQGYERNGVPCARNTFRVCVGGV